MLLNGEHAVCARCEPAANELLQAHFAKLQCSIDVVAGERRRLADPYQAAFIGRGEASGSAERRLEVWRDLSAPLVAEPLVADLEAWMRTQRAGLSRHASVAKAVDCMLKRWDAGIGKSWFRVDMSPPRLSPIR